VLRQVAARIKHDTSTAAPNAAFPRNIGPSGAGGNTFRKK
jgi:hypothetical protein